MKKILVFALALMGATSLMAADYTHSVGVVAGGMNGFSYKGFITDNLAIQADLAVGLSATKGHTYYATAKVDGEKMTMKEIENKMTVSRWDFIANPNLVYQGAIANGFSWFVGGGLSMGMVSGFAVSMDGVRATYNATRDDLMGKFGLNALTGVEYKFPAAPVVMGVDFRPGYGLDFKTEKEQGVTTSISEHYFDWKLALAVRYCF